MCSFAKHVFSLRFADKPSPIQPARGGGSQATPRGNQAKTDLIFSKKKNPVILLKKVILNLIMHLEQGQTAIFS